MMVSTTGFAFTHDLDSTTKWCTLYLATADIRKKQKTQKLQSESYFEAFDKLHLKTSGYLQPRNHESFYRPQYHLLIPFFSVIDSNKGRLRQQRVLGGELVALPPRSFAAPFPNHLRK